MVSVYNLNGVDARSLLASTDPDDILSIESFPCTARVEVFSAFFCQPYIGPRGISRPCMKMVGRVASLFIEDEDDRVFPCNSKELQLMVPEDVMVEYVLSPEEIASLSMKGLFHDPNFQPPANLVDNVIEIPVAVAYKAIYDTPVCAVEILSPMEITTSTKDNSYYGLFEACPVSEVIAQMEAGTYEYARMNEPKPALVPGFEPPEVERQAEPEPGDEMGAEDREDAAIIERVAGEISAEDAKAAEKRQQMDETGRDRVRDEVLRRAQEDAARDSQAEAEAMAPEAQLYGEVGEGPEEGRDKSRSPSHLYDRLMQHAKDATERDDRTDEERSYEESNEEPEEQDGLPADAVVVDEEDGKKGTSKAEAAAKKSKRAAQRVDIAEDLKALNEGRTDIAGFGTGDVPKEGGKPGTKDSAGMAQDLIAKARARAQEAAEAAPAPKQPEKQDDQQSFL